ncbi:uncharacterized protein AMSG_04759 [Thecamonas trahens ATCC 50062]|uniref:DUF4440 domain-containing protein n=1 Tax=Thecamonas trahens ATCC 50062 TaxID=461836 RepID=A0A0L0DAA2_THETB|nr:hypothetical protein AMSG_04759 [Thecamonas trahens ATCC 50062]KNC49016.1 hypothetical protein AMSG_04759 [Thecamonas trahens ATCC 50062]|eukprot:XP_013758427.1 hypothetical protein AMSG_04759 [Thecamonas trahens ATCC 50062]
MVMRFVIVALALAALFAAASATTDSLMIEYKELLLSGECEQFGSLWTDDGVIYGPQGNAFTGPATIATFCSQYTSFAKLGAYSYQSEFIYNGETRALAKYLVSISPAGKELIATGYNTYSMIANATAPHGFLFTEVTGFGENIAYP